MSLDFWITALLVTASPGAGALFTLGAGLGRGTRASLIAALGCTLGIVPHLAVAVSGAAVLVATHPVALVVLQYAGSAYLLWMAWATLRSRGALSVDGDSTPRPALRMIGTAVALNLLNPKLTLFFLAFLPQFVRSGAPSPALAMLPLGAAFMGLTLAVFAGYGMAASAVSRVLTTRPRVMLAVRHVLALSLVALAARLALGGL